MGEAWLFPGQGSQHAGMLARLQTISGTPVVRRVLRAAERYCSKELLIDATVGSRTTLAQPKNAEIGITIYGLACARLLRRQRGMPGWVFGYSAGETAALVVAGVFDEASALEAASIRGRVLQQHVCSATRTIAVSGVPVETVHAALGRSDDDQLAISAYNTFDHCTVVGPCEELVTVARQLRRQGAVISDVDVLGPWHTSRVAPATEELLSQFAHLKFARPCRPLLMSASGCFEEDPERIRKLYACQVAQPVRFSTVLRRLRLVAPTTVVDAGPGRTLYGFLRRDGRGAERAWNVCSAERPYVCGASGAAARCPSSSNVGLAARAFDKSGSIPSSNKLQELKGLET